MKQMNDYGDDRNKNWCVFCGGPNETRDHVPSRVLLDEPYPTTLPVVPACAQCNGSFSLDESYLACLIECALTGSVELASNRTKIGGILARSPALTARLNHARYEEDGHTGFSAETVRIRTVLVKLARGHAAYEQNEPQLHEPISVSFAPFTTISEEQRATYETGNDNHGLWPETGSRAMQRVVGVFFGSGQSEAEWDLNEDGWVMVQPQFYRYRVECGDEFRVQMVIREYLAAEVVWE